jgi:hypothetical protein
MRKTFHSRQQLPNFVSSRACQNQAQSRGLSVQFPNEPSSRSRGLFGIAFALLMGGGTERMSSRAPKAFVFLLSLILLTSAFMERRSSNGSKSLLFLGSGLVGLAGLSRRHFADEE